jgi:predicted transcriptional regulator
MARKTTVYFSDELKAAIERAAARRQLSEAQVIREAVADALRAPRPTAALLDVEPFAERTEELLAGFGSR